MPPEAGAKKLLVFLFDFGMGYDKTRVVKSEEIDHLVMERGVRRT